MVFDGTSTSLRRPDDISSGCWRRQTCRIGQKSRRILRCQHGNANPHQASHYGIVLIASTHPRNQAIDTDATEIHLVNSFVVSRLDCCNSFLAGLRAYQLEKIRSVLNYAARLICGRRKCDHVTSLLCDNLN